MKYINLKALFPHFVAIAIFLIVTVIFCKPALESDTILKQSDVAGWQGMSHQALDYKEKHGHLPLWVSNMFSGMPGYQIAMEGNWSPLAIINSALQLWLPQPLNFFFLACICFYILCLCLRIKPYASIIGALGFAYCSFSPIIITAGHNTQMLALAYAPAVIGAVILVFDKKYIAGFTLSTLFIALQIGQAHQQISYYLFLILIAMSISYAIYFIKNKQYTHLLKSGGLLIIAGIIGIGANALVLMTTFDYSKESKRGGQLIMDEKINTKDVVKDGKTQGLTKDYAFMWSYGKEETWSLLFPGVMGYGSHQAERDGEGYIFPSIDEKGHLVKYVTDNLPQVPADQIVNQMQGTLYWGNQPFTNGPIYLGAIICFLFIFGMFYLEGKHKWWILAAAVFGILLSWGENLPSLNYWMFDHFPMYNKFRVPTMALVIPQIIFPIIAVLVIDKLIKNEDALGWDKFKKASITTLGVFALITLFYISSDFAKENKERTIAFNTIIKNKSGDINAQLSELNNKYKPAVDNQIYEGMTANLSQAAGADASASAREFVSALRQDRAALLLSDIIRSLILIMVCGALIALYLKKKVNMLIMLVGVTLLSTIDLLQFGSKYLNNYSFDNKDSYEANEFPLSNADNQILQDKDPNFRVFNTASLEESKTSYYHKSIGGYHPAKMGIYDDLMTYQLSGSPNIAVLNMLNTKYVIQPQGNDKVASINPGALGNTWFIKNVSFVRGPIQEMKALNAFNPKDTAFVDESFKDNIGSYSPADSSSSIRMTSFDNDTINYKTHSNANQIAVFSEIYYKDWNAYIDGKPAKHFKANYVLRAMNVPAGDHEIQFRFEPASFYSGRTISDICNWIVTLLLIAYLVKEIINNKGKHTA